MSLQEEEFLIPIRAGTTRSSNSKTTTTSDSPAISRPSLPGSRPCSSLRSVIEVSKKELLATMAAGIRCTFFFFVLNSCKILEWLEYPTIGACLELH